MQNIQLVSAGTEGSPPVKPSISHEFGSGLRPIGRTRFEAKRLRQDPFNYGYRVQIQNTRKIDTQDLSRLWVAGPAKLFRDGFADVFFEEG